MKDYMPYLKKQFRQRWNRQVYTVCVDTHKAKTQFTIKVCISINNPITFAGGTVRSRQIQNISRMVAELCNLRFETADNAIIFGGSGTDVGEAIVQRLSTKLYGDAYALAQHWI